MAFTETGQWADSTLTETGQLVNDPITEIGQIVFGLAVVAVIVPQRLAIGVGT